MNSPKAISITAIMVAFLSACVGTKDVTYMTTEQTVQEAYGKVWVDYKTDPRINVWEEKKLPERVLAGLKPVMDKCGQLKGTPKVDYKDKVFGLYGWSNPSPHSLPVSIHCEFPNNDYWIATVFYKFEPTSTAGLLRVYFSSRYLTSAEMKQMSEEKVEKDKREREERERRMAEIRAREEAQKALEAKRREEAEAKAKKFRSQVKIGDRVIVQLELPKEAKTRSQQAFDAHGIVIDLRPPIALVQFDNATFSGSDNKNWIQVKALWPEN